MSAFALLCTWILLCLGPTVALTQASVLEPVRVLAGRLWAPLGELSRCALCVGFWVGAALCFVAPTLGPAAALYVQVPVYAVLNGLCSAAICWIVVTWVSR